MRRAAIVVVVILAACGGGGGAKSFDQQLSEARNCPALTAMEDDIAKRPPDDKTSSEFLRVFTKEQELGCK